MERGDGKPLNEDMILMSSRKSSIEGIQPKDSITSQYEQSKVEFEQMLLDILNKNKGPSKKNQGTVDNLLPQFPKHMTKVLEQNGNG